MILPLSTRVRSIDSCFPFKFFQRPVRISPTSAVWMQWGTCCTNVISRWDDIWWFYILGKNGLCSVASWHENASSITDPLWGETTDGLLSSVRFNGLYRKLHVSKKNQMDAKIISQILSFCNIFKCFWRPKKGTERAGNAELWCVCCCKLEKPVSLNKPLNKQTSC